MVNPVKKTKEPLIHMTKRDDITGGKAWLIRFAAIFLGLLLSGVMSALLTGASFFEVYGIMFKGVFGRLLEGKLTLLWRFLQQTAILLCLALAVTPAFRMRFWNCGAEGQALMGGLAAMVCMIEIGDKVPYPVLLLIVVVASVAAGAIWGLIPALFQARPCLPASGTSAAFRSRCPGPGCPPHTARDRYGARPDHERWKARRKGSILSDGGPEYPAGAGSRERLLNRRGIRGRGGR